MRLWFRSMMHTVHDKFIASRQIEKMWPHFKIVVYCTRVESINNKLKNFAQFLWKVDHEKRSNILGFAAKFLLYVFGSHSSIIRIMKRTSTSPTNHTKCFPQNDKRSFSMLNWNEEFSCSFLMWRCESSLAQSEIKIP